MSDAPTPPEGLRRLTLPLVMAVALIAAFAFQGTRGLYETTEGRYAECAREMLEGGHLLTPTLDNQPHWTKPPPAYWAIAGGVALFGRNAWGARACGAVTFVLTILAVYGMGRRLFGEQAGLLAALVQASSAFSVIGANSVSTDMLLALFETLAMLWFWGAVRTGRRGYVTLLWCALGAAFATKGPVGLMPLLGIIPAWIVARHRLTGVPALANLPGVLLFVLIGFGWYGYMALTRPGLAAYWLGYETFGRFTSGRFHNPGWYWAFMYVGILAFGGFPWVLALIARWREIPGPSRWKKPSTWSVEAVFLVASVFFPLLVFSASTSKLPLYVLPQFSAVSVALGFGLKRLLARGKLAPKAFWALCLASVILIVSAKGAAALVPSRKDMTALAAAISAQEKALPAPSLFIAGGDDLHGLEFHLGRVLPKFGFATPEGASEPPAASLPQRIREDLSRGRASLILVRAASLSRLEGILRQGAAEPGGLPALETRRLTRDWDLVVAKPRV